MEKTIKGFRRINVKDIGAMYVTTVQDHINIQDEGTRDIYAMMFAIIIQLANRLNLDCPYLGIANELTRPDHIRLDAFSRATSDSNLDRDLLLVSEDVCDNSYYLVGVLAHEMRHLWQNKYRPDEYHDNAFGAKVLYNPAEIDADGFAMFFLTQITKISLDQAGAIMCASEKLYDDNAYRKRLQQAADIAAQTHYP